MHMHSRVIERIRHVFGQFGIAESAIDDVFAHTLHNEMALHLGRRCDIDMWVPFKRALNVTDGICRFQLNQVHDMSIGAATLMSHPGCVADSASIA